MKHLKQTELATDPPAWVRATSETQVECDVCLGAGGYRPRGYGMRQTCGNCDGKGWVWSCVSDEEDE